MIIKRIGKFYSKKHLILILKTSALLLLLYLNSKRLHHFLLLFRIPCGCPFNLKTVEFVGVVTFLLVWRCGEGGGGPFLFNAKGTETFD